MRGILIPADESLPMREVDLGGDNWSTLVSEVPKLLGCQYAERVQTPRLHKLAQPDYDPIAHSGGSRWPSVIMFVNELGHIEGGPMNPRAALLYGGPTGIIGDAIIFGERAEWDEKESYDDIVTAALPTGVTVDSLTKYIASLRG